MGGPSDVIYTRKGQTVCRSADIIDVAKFLIFNYLIHAFTVISSPGETILSSFVAALRALFVPGVGLERAGAVIHKAPIWLRRGPESDEVPKFRRFWIWVKARFGYRPQGDYSEPLAIALAAGALCTIVKHDELKSLGLDERWAFSVDLIHLCSILCILTNKQRYSYTQVVLRAWAI